MISDQLHALVPSVEALSQPLGEELRGIADQVAVLEEPMPQSVAYRCQTRHLFQPVSQATIPPRLPGQTSYKVETSGPTKLAVDAAIGWLWATPGGDKSPAFATIPANAYPKGGPGGWYTIDATAALREAIAQNRPWAFLLYANVSRTMLMRESSTPPVLVVERADGSTTPVPAWVTTSAGATSPNQLVREAAMPSFVEFDRPEVDPDDVVAARIEFYVSQHNGVYGAAVFSLHLLIPDISLPPVEGGFAESYPGDVGIQDDPRVLMAHSYADGVEESVYLDRVNRGISSARNYSGNVFDLTAPADTAKLPYTTLGRFTNVSENVSIVDSSYQGEGFVPYRPGMGALRLHMPLEARAAEGGMVGNAGTLCCRLESPLAVPLIGRQPTICIRYAMRWTRPGGVPEMFPLDAIKAVWQIQSADGTLSDPNWTSVGGKTGIVGTHDTSYDGFSGSAGDDGWQNRLAMGYIPTGRVGPQSKGKYFGLHMFDFQQAKHPLKKGSAGSTIPDMAGRVGGVLYPDRWYIIQQRLKLNSVDQIGLVNGLPVYRDGEPQYWAEDGEATLWVDGMRVWHQDKLCMRMTPISNPPTYDPATSSYLGGIGDVGVRAIMLNIFHGGVTPSAVEDVTFIAGVVVSTGDPIGPMVS